MYTAIITNAGKEPRMLDVLTSSAMRVAGEYGTGTAGEEVTIYDNKGRPKSSARCDGSRYERALVDPSKRLGYSAALEEPIVSQDLVRYEIYAGENGKLEMRVAELDDAPPAGEVFVCVALPRPEAETLLKARTLSPAEIYELERMCRG